MSGYRIEIQGLSKVQDGMRIAPAEMKKELNAAIKKSILEVHRNTILAPTPVRTGNLSKGFRAKLDFLNGILTNIVKYAVYVEYGTKRFSGRFYLKKGVENSKERIQKFFEKAIDNVIVKIVNR